MCPSFEVATKIRLARKGKEGISNDLHERDMEFMKKVYDNAVFVAKYLNWDFVVCDDGLNMREIDDIHKEIVDKVNSLLK